MADRFYLGIWLRDYSQERMLDRFRALLEAFPYSAERPKARTIRVYPLNWSEHPVLEEDFREGADTDYIVSLASEFLHGDYAYESGAFWDLWVFQTNGGPGAWKNTPLPVKLICAGPDFEEGRAEDGHLQVEFGTDTPFRAGQQPQDRDARVLSIDYREKLQDNIRKLLGFVQAVEKKLPVEKRLLWTESGENFAEVVERSLK